MANKFVPAGSYAQTCRNIKVTLNAKARKINGSWVPANLDLTGLAAADIENLDGVLHNTGKDAPTQGFVPGGSYAQTCSNIQVILTCEAQKLDGSWHPAGLDITHVPPPGDIANMDGVLVNN